VGAQGPQFDADKTVRLHVVSDPVAGNRLRFRLCFGRSKAWMAGTWPAKTKSAGRFGPLSGRKIFPGQPYAKAGIQGAILRTRP
jgi:hypothetical protein